MGPLTFTTVLVIHSMSLNEILIALSVMSAAVVGNCGNNGLNLGK